VHKVVARVRHWWNPGLGENVPPVEYAVACVCGTVSRGPRQSCSQVIACSACGRKLFILPVSPYPPVAGLSTSASPGKPLGPRPSFSWRLPVAAACLTLVAVGGVFFVYLYPHLRSFTSLLGTESIGPHIDAGRTALAQGKFQLAVHELEAAQGLAQKNASSLSAGERRRLNHWQLQARLLADLLPNSLEEIVRHASELEPDDKAWLDVFAQRYRGHSVVFDAEVRLDGAGKYHLSYVVLVDGQQAVLDFATLQLFKLLPLDKPERLLFGARLASVHREDEGSWVIRFEPASGVLFTDRDAAAACSPQTAEELDDLVRRQASWLGLMEN
jgi:hypothetical protein